MKDRSTQPICVFEDCLKRNGIILMSDIVVDALRIMLHVSQLKNSDNNNSSSTSTTAATITQAAVSASAKDKAEDNILHNSSQVHTAAVSNDKPLTKVSRWSTFVRL